VQRWGNCWPARGFLKADNCSYVLACLKDASSGGIIFFAMRQYGSAVQCGAPDAAEREMTGGRLEASREYERTG